MEMSDDPKRKLTIPSWQIPYLEKHNIFKLFYELARELVVHQPEDHVIFIKQLITSAVTNMYIPHVILLGSPKINLLEVGQQIAKLTGQILITDVDVVKFLNKKNRNNIKTNEFMIGLQELIKVNEEEMNKRGWILVDCIKTAKDAKKLVELGTLPTHVLFLISPYSPKLTDLLYCNVDSKWAESRRAMHSITEIYKKKLIEIHINNQLIQDVVNKCIASIKTEKIDSTARQARILIIGPRGCGRKTQAKLIANKLNIIHIDFEYLLCQAWISATEIGSALRDCHNTVSLHSDLLTEVLRKRILESDCLKLGWVLTGYPFNEIDMRFIDCLETPPNRIIFLECNLNICLQRLNNRRVDCCTGEVFRNDVSIDDITAIRLKIHPKDKADIINAELQYYCMQYGALRKYCGNTATVINADQPESWIHEAMIAYITQNPPISSPREPFTGESDIVNYLSVTNKY